jgi:hypothetical protein
MARGGKRPGAGRKPGLRIEPKAHSPIRAAELKLAENLPELIDLALSWAKGGDKQLLVYCIDRVLGRTVQPISVETQAAEIAADFGVEPARVVSIIERLKAKKAG